MDGEKVVLATPISLSAIDYVISYPSSVKDEIQTQLISVFRDLS